MATQIRNTSPNLPALVTEINQLKDSLIAELRPVLTDLAAVAADADVSVTTTFTAFGFHNDKSEVTVTAANASDLATSLTLVNEIVGVYVFHMADTLAHKVVGVDLASTAVASTLAAAILLANDVKSKYNTHRASTTYHYTADSTNVTTSSDATDQSSLNTLLNEIKTDFNAHMASGPVMKSLRLLAA